MKIQDINQDDIKLIAQVLTNDFLTQGPINVKFEESITKVTHTQYAKTVNSATSALISAYHALGLKKDGRLWTSPITFLATTNMALTLGAEVDFVDIDPKTFNLSIKTLELKLIEAKKNNTLPNIVVPVHMAGLSCDMESIARLSKKYGFKIIEDASHALGSTYNKKPVGNCEYSEATVFSFHAIKNITTAEGGAVTTQKKEINQSIELFRSHGITRDRSLMVNKDNNEGWYYEQIDMGYNFRMPELNAALGLSQIKRLNYFIQKRNQIAQWYTQYLNTKYFSWQENPNYDISAYHLFIIQLKDPSKRKSLFNILREQGFIVTVNYIPIYKQPYYQRLGFSKNYCVHAETYYTHTLSLPISTTMNEHDVKMICEIANQHLK